MMNFKCVNLDKKTIWLDINKVLYISQPGEKDNQEQTVIKLITGEELILEEDYQEILEDWGIVKDVFNNRDKTGTKFTKK